MEFDKTAYRISKRRVIEQIKATHDWQNTEGFIADGVICPDVYEKQTIRILCILAESYGYDGCADETDIEAQGIEDVLGVTNRAVKTTRTLPSLLWLLTESLERGSMMTWDEFPNLLTVTPVHTELLQETLAKVAWINVKKASRSEGTEIDSGEVYEHATRNLDVLQQQISSIAPHLVIVGGFIVFQALYDMEMLDGVSLGKKWNIQSASSGRKVVEVSHPSPRNPDWRSYESIYDHFVTLYRQLAPVAP